MYKFKYIH